MSEFDGQEPGGVAVPQQAFAQDVPVEAATAGSLIRQAREAAGLHIAALAVALKVPVKKLEALEADRLDLLPDAVFVRALASSVCRTLKMDATQVLALLPQTGKPRLDYQHASINAPFRAPSDGPGPSLLAQVSRPAVLAGVLLLLGALVLIFLPALQPPVTTAAPNAGPQSAVAQPAPQAQASPLPAVSPVHDTAQSAGVPGTVVASTATDTAAPASPVMASGAAAPAPAPALEAVSPAAPMSTAAAPAPVSATGTVVFTASGESWVEVTDAKGVVVLRRTLAAGEAAGASGTLPLAAVVGRVDVTQVQVRGRPFDLGPVSKDNVARFEVK